MSGPEAINARAELEALATALGPERWTEEQRAAFRQMVNALHAWWESRPTSGNAEEIAAWLRQAPRSSGYEN